MGGRCAGAVGTPFVAALDGAEVDEPVEPIVLCNGADVDAIGERS